MHTHLYVFIYLYRVCFTLLASCYIRIWCLQNVSQNVHTEQINLKLLCRCFYPKRLTLHSTLTLSFVHAFPGNWTHAINNSMQNMHHLLQERSTTPYTPSHCTSFFTFSCFYTLTTRADAFPLGNYRYFKDAVIPNQLEWVDLPAGSRMCSTVASDRTAQKRDPPRQPAPAWTDWWVGGRRAERGSVGRRGWAVMTFGVQTQENAVGKALVAMQKCETYNLLVTL